MDYSYVRYLSSKKTVDDRALNSNVWQHLSTILHSQAYNRRLRVLEVGAGIGTMIERVFEWGLLENAIYTAVDIDPVNIKEAHSRLSRWANKHSIDLLDHQQNEFILKSRDRYIQVKLVTCDFFDFYNSVKPGHWDLVIAHAFLDLINLDKTIPKLLSLLSKSGLFYFTHNFNGVTIFKPTIDKKLDAQIINYYHKTMDNRKVKGGRSGGSMTGRDLHLLLNRIDVEILDFGDSNWKVSPINNHYFDDEAYFLHYIIHTIDKALDGDPNIDTNNFKKWIQSRHEQIRQAELTYITHQVDFLGRFIPFF
ncbi:hypothetical protein [[Eubacterium] cellulosolvens]